MSTALVRLADLPPEYDAGLLCVKCGCPESTTSYRNPEFDDNDDKRNKKQIFVGYTARDAFQEIQREKSITVREASWWRGPKYGVKIWYERQAVRNFDPKFEYVEVLHKSCAKCGYTWQEMTKDFVMPTKLPTIEGEGNVTIMGDWVTNSDGSRTKYPRRSFMSLGDGEYFDGANRYYGNFVNDAVAEPMKDQS